MKKIMVIALALFLAACSTSESASDEKKLGTRSNPVPFGESITVEDTINGEYDAKVELKVLEVIRGEKAWEIAKNENSYNETPEEGYEYILAKVEGKVTEAETEDEPYWLSASFFKFVSEEGNEYEVKSVVIPDELAHNLYNGGTGEGYVHGYIKKDDDVTLSYNIIGKPLAFFLLK